MTGQVRNEVSGGIFLSALIQGRDLQLHLPPAVPQARSGLPAATAVFCGRAAELETLLDTLSPVPEERAIAAVSGIPGAGKTQLALRAAQTALARGWFPGGALFADAGGPDGPDAGAILDGFLCALGVLAGQIPIAVTDRAALYDQILSALDRRGARVLIVLDASGSRARLDLLLPRDGVRRALVTTAGSGWASFDRTVRATSLSSDESTELLSRVLDLAQAGDTRVRDDHAAAAAICDLCGGLPLAVRVVGALLAENPALTLADVAVNLQPEPSRIDELDHPGGGVRECFDRAHRSLSLRSASALRLLSAVSGGSFNADEAAVATGLDRHAVITALRELSCLLDYSPADGRWQVPALVRLYVNDLGSGRPDGRCRDDHVP